MSRRVMFVLIAGIAGLAVLLSLGIWQVQRLAWKEAILADIEARIVAGPVALPDAPDPEADRYLPVAVEGVIGPEALRVLVSRKQVGAGYRLINAFETVGGRRVLLDRGFVPVDAPVPAPPEGVVRIEGNLHWPDETDGFTPDPDPASNMWFARDTGRMAAELGTEPVLIVLRARSFQDGAVVPLPVDTAGIPNDHLQYAITWFSLAVVWAGMTGLFLWRTRRAAEK